MKIHLSLSSRLVNGKAEILSRIITSKTGVYRAKLRIFIEPSRFKNEKVIIPRINCQEQKELLKLKSNLENVIQFISECLIDPSISIRNSADVQELIDNFYNPQNKASFFHVWDNWADAQKVTAIRKRKYQVVRSDLERFEQYTCRKLRLEMGTSELQEFERFLRNEHNWNPPQKPRGDTALASILNVLKAFYNYLLREGIIQVSPFTSYSKPKELYGTPYFLTIDERNAIASMEFNSEALNRQRDIFIFQCLVGCRVGDLMRLTKANIVDGILEYTPSKTIDSNSKVVSVPLNDKALTILGKYAHLKDSLLPFISPQKYNEAIKDICRLAGIDRIVTVLNPLTHREERKPIYEVASSHMARRTFIGNLYNQVQDPNLIGSMSGHAEGSKAFARYRNIDNNLKKKIIELIK